MSFLTQINFKEASRQLINKLINNLFAGTSEPEVDDMGVPIWDGVSKGNAAKNDKKPGKK